MALSGKKLIGLAAALLAVLFIVLGCMGAAASAGHKPIDSKKGVAWVYCEYSDGYNSYGSSGTGWAIGKPGEKVQYFVTNGHVVEGARTYRGEVRVYYSYAENDYVVAEVVYYSPADEYDIALLKIPTPTDKRQALVLRPSDTVEQGEEIYVIGYPGLASYAQILSRYDMEDVTITQGIVGKRTTISWAKYDCFQMDASTAGGNSGGPVVDSRGNVVGIHTISFSSEEEQGVLLKFSIAIDNLIRILDYEGYAYTTTGYKNWMMYVFWPLAAVALGFAALFLFKKTKAGEAPAVYGVSGGFAGQKFDASKRQTFGRNGAVCTILFPPDAPGVSGNHCSIYYEPREKGYILTDNGSTYGTYLGNGVKLTPGAPALLKPGDAFYLADPGTRFVAGRKPQ